MPYRIAIVGTGWRTEFFLRVIAALPERFALAGVVTRDPSGRRDWARPWGAPPLYDSLATLAAAEAPDGVVVSVPASLATKPVEEAAGLGLPLLRETPAGMNLEDLRRMWALSQSGARIEVAEQYPFQPLHASRLALMREGLIGAPRLAEVSVGHGYHAISLIRNYLGKESEAVDVSAFQDVLTGLEGPGRGGAPAEPKVVDQYLQWGRFRFADALGLYQFDFEQYFSPIRSSRLLVRGTHGEIRDLEVRTADERGRIALGRLERIQTGMEGNLEGMALREIQFQGRRVWANPFFPARLSDEEIAIAECLRRFAGHADPATPSSYSLAAACEDRYLDLLWEQARDSGETVQWEPQPWTH